MSLLVWLPLNDNLENNGLSPAKFSLKNSSGGVTSSSTGGKTSAGMYKRTAETAEYIGSDIDFNLNGDFSMCCWVKPTKISADKIANGVVTNHGHLSGGSGITLRYINDTDYRMSINTGINANDRTYQTYYGITNIYNKWHHLCLTYERATQQYRIYVDGRVEQFEGHGISITYGDNAQPRPICLFAWSTDHLDYSSYRPLCELNDVRVYDHCLSPKEVYEISKGLVAHYQLKGMGSANYLKGADKYTKENPLIRKVTDSSVHNDSYVYYNGVLSATIPRDGKYTWVLECDGIPSNHATSGTTGSSRRFSMWLQNTSTGNHYCWSDYGIGADGRKYGSVTIPAGTYNVRTNLYAADSVNYTVKMWDIKLVEGNYEPNDKWCPHTQDASYAALGFDEWREPDCSGNGNHAFKSDDTVAVVAGAPHYGSSYRFNTTNYIVCGKGPKVTDAITVNCWGYMDNWSEYSGMRLISCTEGGGWNLEPHGDSAENGMCFAVGTGTTSNSYLNAVSQIKLKNLSSGWHMFTGTYDGYMAKIYIDGVLQGIHNPEKGKVPIYYNPNNGIFIAAEAGGHDVSPYGGYFKGRISDCRIYGTALGPDDIKELYSLAASVDCNGNLFARDFQEDKRNCIDKSGTVASGGFSDKKIPTYDMKLKTLPDKSCWARIHYLDLTNDTTCFQSAAEVDRCLDKHNRYSRMKDVPKYKVGTTWEFMLEYPTIKKNLPAGYTELDYIETNGSQLIRTGVYGYAEGGYVRGHRWELEMQFETNGVRQLMGYGPYGYEYWGMAADGYYEGMGKKAGNRDLIVHDYSNGTAGNNSLWVDYNSRGVGANLETSYEYTLFGLKWGENTGYFTYTKFYRGRCIQGTSLIRDFVPARRNSDRAIGLYDLVNGGFYTQYTGSALKAGYKKGYQELEYIESNGTQYINTGIRYVEGTTYKTTLDVLYTTTSPANQIMGFNGHAGMGIGSEGAAFWECSGHGLAANTRYNLEWTKNPSQGVRTINGSTYTVNSSTPAWNGPLMLFAATTSSTDASVNYYCHSRLYSSKIYVDGVLTRDFVPVASSSGKIGLLDKVTGTFFENLGSGSFIAGPAKQSIPLYNRWIQNGFHNDVATGDSIGFKPTTTSWPAHSGPLKAANSGDTKYDCDVVGTGNWYAPIGQYNIWSGGIPAADGNPVPRTELWIRIDRPSQENQLNIYDNAISAANYIEI